MTREILLSWLGYSDVTPTDDGNVKGPLFDLLKRKEPNVNKVIAIYTSDFKDRPNLLTSKELETQLSEHFPTIEIKIEYAELTSETNGRDISFRSAYDIAQKLLANLPANDRDAQKSAFITSGMLQEGLIWTFLAREYKLKLIACPNHANAPVQQILAPIDPEFFTQHHSSDNYHLFAWLAPPTPGSHMHHQEGAVMAWLNRHQEKTQKVSLLIDFQTQEMLNDWKAFIESSENSRPKPETIPKKIEISLNLKKLLGDKLTIEPVLLPPGDVSSCFYQALEWVEAELKQTDQATPVFLVNSGTKENNLAWILLKLWYRDAKLYAAWKDQDEELSPLTLKYPGTVERHLFLTKDWFEDKTRTIDHNFNPGNQDAAKRIQTLWPYLEEKHYNESTHEAIKHLCGKYSYADIKGHYFLNPASLLFLIDWIWETNHQHHRAYAEIVDHFIGNPDEKWKDLIKTKLTPETKDKERYIALIKGLHDFFQAALINDKANANPNDKPLALTQISAPNEQTLALEVAYHIEAALADSKGNTSGKYRDLQTLLNEWDGLDIALEGHSIKLVWRK